MSNCTKLLQNKESRLCKSRNRANKEHLVSLRLINKAEMALAIGAFFGMLAIIGIVFLPMFTIVSVLIIVAAITAGLSAIVAVTLLIASSSTLIETKLDKKDIEQKKVSISLISPR